MTPKQDSMTRRSFLSFLGQGALAWEAMTSADVLGLSSRALGFSSGRRPFLPPSDEDTVRVADGFEFRILIRQGDPINSRGDAFGFNNDFTAFLPLNEKTTEEGYLWVNHEYPDPLFLASGYLPGNPRTKEQVVREQKVVGGSILHVKKLKDSSHWALVSDDAVNRRLDATTPLPFAWHEPIAGSRQAIGTLANCAGGVTPWGTVLTAEENYQDYYGDRDRAGKRTSGRYGWEAHFDRPPEHYGWIVEVDPRTGKGRKLVALGRFAHEGATAVKARDGRCVVYSGDDANDRCLYKFISSKPGSLERGTLYVADTAKGRWIALDRENNPLLKKHFKSQTELLIHAREAARLAGGTELARPEDIDIHPDTGAVFVALTNNKKKQNFHGSILKIEEKGNNPLSLEFQATDFLLGGEKGGLSCPDNLAFDRNGNLWVTTDISGSEMNRPPYSDFKNNGLFVVPTRGDQAGRVFQVASAPRDAEFTGPTFSPDGKTLFLSVQHPGENSAGPKALTSHWPEGGEAVPRSSVITVIGVDAVRSLG